MPPKTKKLKEPLPLEVILANSVREQNEFEGRDPEFCRGQHELFRLAANHTATFLGKQFEIVWPEGEPSCLIQVLNELLGV